MALTQPDMPLGAKMLLGLSHPVHWSYRVQRAGGFQSQLIFRDYDILDSCEWWEGRNSGTSWSTQGQPELVEEVWSSCRFPALLLTSPLVLFLLTVARFNVLCSRVCLLDVEVYYVSCINVSSSVLCGL